MLRAGGLFFPRRPQVQVILQQLPQQFPAPPVHELLRLGRGQPGRLLTLEVAG